MAMVEGKRWQLKRPLLGNQLIYVGINSASCFLDTVKFLLNECASLARWHRLLLCGPEFSRTVLHELQPVWCPYLKSHP